MSHPQIERSREPIRLFQADWLEFLTHVHPAVVVLIWLPVMLFFLVLAAARKPAGASPFYIVAAFFVGLFLWTPSEYGLHRFVFHYPARTPWGKRASFMLHGIHHAQPRVKTRLVMTPLVSIPLAAVFYGVFALLVGGLLGAPHWVAPLFAGFVAGYLLYDMTHYAMHHVNVPWGYFRSMRQHHMRHHGENPSLRFGVTSKLWDRIFGTLPVPR